MTCVLQRHLLALLILPAAAVPAASQVADPRGVYDFESRSTRGAPFTGVIHLYGEPGRPEGFLYTVIDPPIPIEGVRWLGQDTLGIRFRLGPTLVTQVLAFSGDRFSGFYWFARDGQRQEIPLSGRRRPATPHHDLAPTECGVRGVEGVVRCAMFHVPENPDQPMGRQIPLRMVVLPALEAREPDPMVVFAGGPGQAAVELAGGYAQTMAGIRRSRDIVIVDQRGTGASNPLRCDFGDPDTRARILLTWELPLDGLAACRDQLAARADLRFYHSWMAVGDVDRIREWLGYPALNLYGGSYGTRVAQTYLRRYPDRTRTVTLRGVLPPGEALSLGAARNAQAAVELVLRECAEDAGCRTGYPDLAAELESVVRQLGQVPKTVRVRDPGTGDSTSITVTRAVFGGALRRLLMDGGQIPAVPLVIHRAAAGDLAPLIPGIEATLGVSRSLYLGMGLSVGCSEDAPLLAGADIPAHTRGTFMGESAATGFLEACRVWPSGSPPVGFHDPVREPVPVLLFSGQYDAATPVAWGRQVTGPLPHALHVVLPGIAHGPFPACAQEIMTRFVERGGMVGVSLDCVRQLSRPPFQLPEGR